MADLRFFFFLDYLFEVFVSSIIIQYHFDGVRYGVPWQYSGKEVQVRLCSGILEIYLGEVLLAKHKVQYRSGSIIYLRGQYEGLAERKGIVAPFPCARQRNRTVEVRELSIYDQLLGGISHG
jgi:hypothetical protein